MISKIGFMRDKDYFRAVSISSHKNLLKFLSFRKRDFMGILNYTDNGIRFIQHANCKQW